MGSDLWWSGLLLAAIGWTAGMGCASSEKAEAQGECECARERPAAEAEEPPTVGALYERSKRYLPHDSKVVAAASGRALWRYVELYVPERKSDEVQAGDPGTRKALRRDASELFRERLGVDPLRVEAAVLGANRTSGALVVFGEFQLGTTAEPIEIAGRKAHRLDPQPGGELEELQQAELFVAKFGEEDGAGGLLIAPTRARLKTMLEGDDAREDDGLLPGTDRGETFGLLFGAVEDARFAIASPVSELAPAKAAASKNQLPVPSGIVAGWGSSFQVTLRGSKETLDEIASEVDRAIEKAESEAASGYEEYEASGLLTALSRISTFHTMKALIRRLETERSSGELTYSLAADTVQLGPMLVGAGAAFALPLVKGFLGSSGGTSGGKEKAARTELQELESVVESFYLMQSPSRLPDDLSELAEGDNPVLEAREKLRDPWGNRYRYEKKGEQEFEVYSPGPDGRAGTEDDVYPSGSKEQNESSGDGKSSRESQGGSWPAESGSEK